MVHINYELPDDIHRALKVRAAEEGITLKQLIIRFLYESLRALGALEPVGQEGLQGPSQH